MIISHDLKFIFIKTNKTAGTSVEIALSKFCGPTDILTPISPEDEKTRNDLGYRGPQNYSAPFYEHTISDWIKLFREKTKKQRFYNHISAAEIKQYIDQDVWDNYFKFCIERNPWDRLISLYYFRFKSEPRPTIAEFVSSEAPLILKRRGYDLYTIDGQVVVDKICLYENLLDDLNAVCKRINIPRMLELPKAKSGFRKDKRSYRDILNKQERERITEIFRDEIALFNYEF